MQGPSRLVPLLLALAGCAAGPRAPDPPTLTWPARTLYREATVLGHRLFYREAGDPDRPTVLLLHGFPASSHAYRELIPLLSGRYHLIAPDDLGSGLSDHPDPREVTYTFDLLAAHVTGLVEALGLDRYVLYVQDFGGPVGFRVALAHPERVRGLVVQNANAFLDGLTPARRDFFRRAHEDRSTAERTLLESVVSVAGVRERQYLRDVPGERRERMSPDGWVHDLAFLASPEDREIQVQLFQDYQSNVDAYPAWQHYLRTWRPPTLIVWGARDAAFLPAGAAAYLREVPGAELYLLDAGHFALEEEPVAIAQRMLSFLDRLGP